MTDLAERIEAAGVDEQRAMLEEAFSILFPAPDSGQAMAHKNGWGNIIAPHQSNGANPISPAFLSWWKIKQRFTTMLDAEAYESAAMMLVPEGWDWGCGGHDDPWGWVCPPDREYNESMKAHAATPALALAAAAIRAGGK